MSAKGQLSLGGLLNCFLLTIIGLALTPTVQSSITAVTGAGAGNLTGSALALMGIFPLFWTVLMIAIPVAYIALWMRG